MPDKCRPLKMETIQGGGSQDDLVPTGMNPHQDALDCAGVYIQTPTTDDQTVLLHRVGDKAVFVDGDYPTGRTLQQLAISGSDEKVKVSAYDTTEGYLNGKLVAGDHVTLTEQTPGGDETLEVASTDETVKVSADDTTEGYLEDKVTEGPGVKLTTLNPGGNESLKVSSGKVVCLAWGGGINYSVWTFATSWTTFARLLFPGTSHMQAAVEAIKFIGWTNNGSQPVSFRIYDLSNDQVICEKTGVANEDPTILDFGSVSNVPSGPAMWEIQGVRPPGPPAGCYLNSITIFFEGE